MQEDEYLQLSGIQHYAFCPRQYALIVVEQQWQDNWRTMAGTIMHERVHDSSQTEKRGDTITMRAIKVVSHKLGLSGECDVVEFLRDDVKGVSLHKWDGKYLPYPIEYKRGDGKSVEADKMQLCGQAMCLEEMLLCEIDKGALFYGETHRRVECVFDRELKDKVAMIAKDMHALIDSGHTPKPILCKYCDQCSLHDVCISKLQRRESVSEYIHRYCKEDVDA